MVRVVTSDKRKGCNKARKCVFLGYKEGLKGWIFQTYDTRRIIKSGDATFYEGEWLPQGIQRLSDSETQVTTGYSDPNNKFATLADDEDKDADVPQPYTHDEDLSEDMNPNPNYGEDEPMDSDGEHTYPHRLQDLHHPRPLCRQRHYPVQS